MVDRRAPPRPLNPARGAESLVASSSTGAGGGCGKHNAARGSDGHQPFGPRRPRLVGLAGCPVRHGSRVGVGSRGRRAACCSGLLPRPGGLAGGGCRRPIRRESSTDREATTVDIHFRSCEPDPPAVGAVISWSSPPAPSRTTRSGVVSRDGEPVGEPLWLDGGLAQESHHTRLAPRSTKAPAVGLSRAGPRWGTCLPSHNGLHVPRETRTAGRSWWSAREGSRVPSGVVCLRRPWP
jgi:hypothetical protein